MLILNQSKHLFGVFKEARTAYRERKAEIKADRRAQKLIRDAEREDTRRVLAAYTIEDSRSQTSSRRHASKSKSKSRSVVRYGDEEEENRHHHHHHHRSRRRRSSHRHDLDGQSVASSSRHTTASRRPRQELARRHTSNDVEPQHGHHLEPHLEHHLEHEPKHSGTRSYSAPHIDMDLAYGEFHPSALEQIDSAAEDEDEDEDGEADGEKEEDEVEDDGDDLNGLVGKVRMVLDEAECAQHSATAIMQHLQEKPDAMAAVALTLAEISALVAKMAPTALAALKTSAPAVFALLASPQFLIAAGVGIGVTIVMFGGYKIIKQITQGDENNNNNTVPQQHEQPQAFAFPAHPNNNNNEDPTVEEMVQLNPGPGGGGGGGGRRIENWRRGVADWEAGSVGTSVDGEFITQTAAALSGIHLPLRVNEIRDEEGGSEYSRESRGSRGSKGSRGSRESRSSRRSKTSSSDGGRDREGEGDRDRERRRRKKEKEKEKEKKEKEKEKKEKEKEKTKKPSPLRRLLEMKH